jgi:hypothetical protein
MYFKTAILQEIEKLFPPKVTFLASGAKLEQTDLVPHSQKIWFERDRYDYLNISNPLDLILDLQPLPHKKQDLPEPHGAAKFDVKLLTSGGNACILKPKYQYLLR